MTRGSNSLPLDASKSEALDHLFSALADDCNERGEQLQLLSAAFRTKMAQALEPVVNARYVDTGHSPLRKRQRTAAEIDKLLTSYGVCAAVNGKPALLAAELADTRRPSSAVFVLLEAKRQGFARGQTSVAHLPLELMAAPENSDEILEAARAYARSERTRHR